MVLFDCMISEHMFRECDLSVIFVSFPPYRYLTGMVEKRTLEKYEREAKEKNRETW